MKLIQFNFLIEKYIDFLDAHCFLTGWMYSNISSFIKPVSEETINLFRMQSEFLEQHYTKVRKHFNLDPKGRELNVKSIVDHYKEKFTIGIPSKAEIESLEVPVNKLEKYLEVGYQNSSDRTLTFVPSLTKAVSYIWDISIDKALVKTAQIMIGQSAGSELVQVLCSKCDINSQ